MQDSLEWIKVVCWENVLSNGALRQKHAQLDTCAMLTAHVNSEMGGIDQ